MHEFALEARKAMWGRGSRADWFFVEGEDKHTREKAERRLTAMGTPVETNQRGFMRDLSQWSPSVAQFLIHQEGHPKGPHELTSNHWRVIDYVRTHYHPNLASGNGGKPSLSRIRSDLNLTRGEFSQLFPGGLKSALRISGLPGPRRSAKVSLSPAQRLRAGDWWGRLTG